MKYHLWLFLNCGKKKKFFLNALLSNGDNIDAYGKSMSF